MRRRKIVQLTVGIALLGIAIFSAWYLRSPQFNDYARRRVISELELVTGGQAELRSLTWNLSKLEFEVRDLTIHGLESPDQAPFAHVDRLYIRAKVISLFQRKIGLRRLIAEHPVIHIIVYPDGTTNQPVPKIRRETNRSPINRLFDLAIDRLELHNGEVLWRDQRMPLDASANDVALGVTYAPQPRRYDGRLNIGKLEGKFRDYRPLSSSAEVQFSLTPTEAELKSLKWSAQQTHLEASGRLKDFNHPTLELSYKASADLQQLAFIARLRQLRSGQMAVHGSGTFSMGDFRSSGAILIQDLGWRDAGVQVAGVSAKADFALSREKLSLTKLNAHAFNGILSGDAEVKNWLSSASSAAAGRSAEMQAGSARLRIEGLDVAQISHSLSSRTLPLERIRAVGRADGTVEANWKGSAKRAQAIISVSLAPPAQVGANELPVNAHLEARYDGSREAVDVSTLTLATRDTRLKASGVLAPNSRLAVELVTTDLAELKPALAAFQISELPIDVKGQASFKGTVSGTLAAPGLNGQLEVHDFDLLLASADARQPAMLEVNGPSKKLPRRIHWDALSADLQIERNSAALRNGVLRRGKALIDFDGSTALSKFKFTDNSAFKVALRVRDASVSDLQQMAGLNYPIEGTLNSTLSVSGTKLNPQGAGTAQITNGSAYGQPFGMLRSDLLFTGNEAQVRNLNVQVDRGRVGGWAAYNLKSRNFRFDLSASDLALAELRPLQGGKIQIKGFADLHARGSGTMEQPIVNASLQLRQLEANGEALGDLQAQAVTHGTEMAITGRSHFSSGEINADGSVHLSGEFPANLEVRFARLDFDPLLKTFLQGSITEHSRADGSVRMQGSLRNPKQLNAVAEIGQLRFDVEGIGLQNQGPLRFRYANQVVTIEQFHVVGDGTDLTARGTLPLASSEAAELRADGRINLKLLQSFNPDLLASGVMNLSVVATGSLQKPALTGTAEISNAGISFIDLPNGLSDINGTLVFNQDRLQIQTLTARTGGGMLRLGGSITYSNGLYASLTARGRDIRLRYPPGISAVADANLRFEGNAKQSALSGDVTVTKFGLNPRFDFALYLARSNQPPTVPNPDSPLNNLQLDVHIVSTPELEVQTSLAKVSGDADLHLRGTGSRPVVLGKINVVEGDVFFNGTKYHLDRGDILFTNPVRIEPVFNLEASARVREIDITLGFHGPIDHLNTTYHSDPPLPTADVIGLLAVGRTPEESVLNPQPTPNLTETASNAILSQALNATISSRVQKLFGVSRVKIDPQVGGPENNPNARLTVEQQVSNKVTLTYITNLAQSAQQVIQIEVHVNKRVSVVGVRDENGVFGFDVKIRQSKW